ncbi:hypothetical protein SLEP1_g59062 [Rubroshorea leprosula]|uniref:Uncharacterized protein n=1 Tax=Rubroshorea leprosula TaxID=152421 RepID=A0AAV5MRB1_9ROSI|nr:hypothetical protein SLEP1_g59062 [Rubroshorea leprosula]
MSALAHDRSRRPEAIAAKSIVHVYAGFLSSKRGGAGVKTSDDLKAGSSGVTTWNQETDEWRPKTRKLKSDDLEAGSSSFFVRALQARRSSLEFCELVMLCWSFVSLSCFVGAQSVRRWPTWARCWAGPIPSGFNSLRPISTRGKLIAEVIRNRIQTVYVATRALSATEVRPGDAQLAVITSSASRPRAEHRAEASAPSERRHAREEAKSEDEVPLIRRRTSGGTQPAQAARPVTVRSPNAPSGTVRAAVEPASAPASTSSPRIAYPKGFSYIRAECQPAMVQAMHSFVPPMDNKRAKAFVQQHGGQVAMIKLMDLRGSTVRERAGSSYREYLGSKCKQLATEKASLVDDVNRLQGSEMANRAAAAESQANELAARNNELREELDRARAEKESGIQAAKEEAARVEERARKAEADRDRTQHELDSLKHQVAEADRNLTAAGEALNELKTSHARSISIARAQGAEWFLGSAVFQDAVAVASANVTTEIYNEIRGKVLHHRPDFPIRELVFFDEEELDEQGKILAPLADTIVKLRWDLNEEGVPVWPSSVLEDGEDPAGLPSFDAWVEGAPVAEQEPSSTPPNSQPAVVPASSPVSAPASELTARSPLARSPTAAADASMPVDLTDD